MDFEECGNGKRSCCYLKGEMKIYSGLCDFNVSEEEVSGCSETL